MSISPERRLARRQFALSTLAVGATILAPKNTVAADVQASGRASGPVVLAGVSPRLTIHALDTYHGSPAEGMNIDFSVFDGTDYVLVRAFTINAKGRADEPLLTGETYRPGRYQFILHVDDYFEFKRAKLPMPPFLSKVPVQFKVVNATERIHLPIQFGPWSYAYSRGS